MTSMLGVLREQFPTRSTLGLKEVAEVLYSRGDRAAQEMVRAGIKRGSILPGLRKTGKRWLVPITTLADWMDSLVVAPQEDPVQRIVHHHVSTPVPARRGRPPDSRRVSKRQALLEAQQERALGFFTALLAEFQHMRLEAIPARPGRRKPA